MIQPNAILRPTVFLVEDDEVVRQSFIWMLEQAGVRVQAHETAAELLAAYDATRPGCLVLDLRLPDMSGLDLFEHLIARGCRHPFIIMSGHGDVADATRAMRLGAVDFIEKPPSRGPFLERVRQAIEEDARRRRQKSDRDAVQHRLDALTHREHQVLDLVVAGKPTKQIASQLEIAVKTVEVHRSSITKKLQVDSVAQLVRIVLEHS